MFIFIAQYRLHSTVIFDSINHISDKKYISMVIFPLDKCKIRSKWKKQVVKKINV